jgi:hypothetical protein
VRQEVDSLISAIGGLLFAEISSLWLPASAGWPVRIVGAVGFVAVLWYAVLRKRPPGAAPSFTVAARNPQLPDLRVARDRRHTAWRAALRPVLRQPVVVLPWVVIVAGLHFIPFRDAFGIPLSDRLGGVLFGLGILGGALVLRWSPAFSPWTGVAAGLVLLGFAAATARVRDTKTPAGGRVGAR